MRLVRAISALLQDPPPLLAFEVSEAGIGVAHIPRSPARMPEIDFRPLKPEVISVSPLRDNILQPDELASAVIATAPPNGNRKRRDVALILPDYCARTVVLDFDNFPSDKKEQLSLVRFRLKKSVPYDIESAALSYWLQPRSGKKVEVVAAVAPVEIIARYEAPFRAAGLYPGFVTLSSIAVLDLIQESAPAVLAKLIGRVLAVMVIENGALRLTRCLELAQAGLDDIAADLFPTFIFMEDHLGLKAQKLLLCGFGASMEEARQRFFRELGIEVEPVRSLLGPVGENIAGLLGYLQSVVNQGTAR